ncbi:MAG TPA: ATP-binding protein [Candidatus Binatia bacterium]
MARGTGAERRFGIEPKAVARALAPALVGGLAAALLPITSDLWRVVAALVAAAATAVLVAAGSARRIGRVAAWARGVRSGERVTPPLPTRAPDAFDALTIELGEMASELRDDIARLENERDRLEAILAAMVEGVIVIDRNGTILRANDPVVATFGLEPGRPLVGLRLWDLTRDVEFNAVVREAMASRTPTFREVELRGAIERHLRVAVGPTADQSAWVLVFHDVTETKRLERVRTDFVANVSHELRTPLTAIKGFAETLLSSGFDDRERAQHFVAIIDRHAERLGRLIDDLLILSDLELGKMPMRVRASEVAPIVRDVVELLGEPARRKRIDVQTSVPDGLRVQGDPDRLAQVVSNLLDNAIKYTPEDGRVRVLARSIEGGARVELAIEDTGVGIPADELPRLAERFYRVDKARLRERGGTGLGLSIVKHIVHAHSGSVRFDSRLGHGTTVTVTLPGCPQADAGG